jgi:hypothetical protein
MSITIVSHKLIPERGIEEIILEDCHGRKLHLQAPIFGEVDIDGFLAQQIAEFESQERKISEHIRARGFDPLTREKK